MKEHQKILHLIFPQNQQISPQLYIIYNGKFKTTQQHLIKLSYSHPTSPEHISQSLAQKKRKLVFQKIINKVPFLLNYSYVFKISQSLIINERALKQDHRCDESFMSTIFFFKSIQSIKLNNLYVSLKLKDIQNNQFPISYYTERFKSFGDVQFYQLANTLENLDIVYSKRGQKSQMGINQEEQRKTLRIKLQETLQKYKGKRILCLYSQPTGLHVTLNQMILSTQLLSDLGYKAQEISKQFIRYHHVFFEIFDTSFYRQILKKASQRLKKSKTDDSYYLDEQTYTDYIFRLSSEEHGYFQQKLKAEIRYSKPHLNISVYEITQIYQDKFNQILPRKSSKHELFLKEWEKNIITQQILNLSNMEYNNLQQIFQS